MWSCPGGFLPGGGGSGPGRSPGYKDHDMSKVYRKEILRKIGYKMAHAVGNPMEVSMKLILVKTNNKQPTDFKFPYCEDFGMLM